MKTIIDVARHAGVSKSTVSRYLNGEPVKEKNRKEIEKAIKELNYHINPIARGLKTRHTDTIGVIIPNLTDLFVTYIIQSCERILNEKGYSIILCDAEEDIEKEKERLEFLVGKKVDGIIIEPVGIEGAHIQKVVKSGIPVVLVDRMIEGASCDNVLVDNFQGAFQGMSAILQRGHRQIGIITGPDSVYTAAERYRGCVEAVRRWGFTIQKDYIVNGGYTRDGGKKAFTRLMSLENPPTAVFISNFYEAIGVIEVVFQERLRIPEDVSLLTFDSMNVATMVDISALITPKIAAIQQPMTAIGEKAAQCIMERVNNTSLPPRIFYLPTVLDITESIGWVKG